MKRKEKIAKVEKSMMIANLAMAGVIGVWLMTQTGCTMLVAPSSGIKSLGDTLNGLVAQSKAPPSRDIYFKTRMMEVREDTRRSYAPGILDSLFGKASATVVNEAKSEGES